MRGRGRGQRQRGGGNNRGGGGIRSRAWCFTINNYKSVPETLPDKMKYLCFGKEVGKENKTPHLQGYVMFKHAVYRPSKYFEQYGNGHFEVARGSVQQNIAYCSKEGDFAEFGVQPQDAARRGARGGPYGARGGEMEIARYVLKILSKIFKLNF